VTELPSALRSRRVAVVSSQLWPGYNELWDAVEPAVGAMSVIGGRSDDDAGEAEPRRVALAQVDLGRGLVWQHLVGLRRHLRAFRPDLVHVNRELWTVVAQEVVGLDTAVVVHGAENLWHHGNPVEQSLRRRLVDRGVRRIRGYASWNQAGADHVVRRRGELGLDPLPTLVLPAVVPPATFRDVTWQPGPADPLEVLLVGRAVRAKGFEDVLEAADGVAGVRVTLCGEGPLLDDLRRLAERRGVTLTTPGQLPPAELAALMARCHLLVQPSRTTADWAEQFGRSVAEAMTVGLPVLVSDSGELPRLVGCDARSIVPEGDGATLRARLQQLVAEPGALHALAASQHEHARAWESTVAGAALLRFWSQVLR
jgi:colanic acid/amylovoran biosynthesis glycosyltransferase